MVEPTPDAILALSDIVFGFILGSSKGIIKYNPTIIRPYHQWGAKKNVSAIKTHSAIMDNQDRMPPILLVNGQRPANTLLMMNKEK